MSKFDISISKNINNCNNMNTVLTKYKKHLENAYFNINNVKTSWTGNDCDEFLHWVNKDREEALDVVNNLQKYNQSMLNFNNALSTLLVKNGYEKGYLSLKYDSSKIPGILEQINNIKDSLSLVMEYFSIIRYNQLMAGNSKMNETINNLNTIKKELDNYKLRIEEVSNNINNTLEIANTEINRIELTEFLKDNSDYNNL